MVIGGFLRAKGRSEGVDEDLSSPYFDIYNALNNLNPTNPIKFSEEARTELANKTVVAILDLDGSAQHNMARLVLDHYGHYFSDSSKQKLVRSLIEYIDNLPTPNVEARRLILHHRDLVRGVDQTFIAKFDFLFSTKEPIINWGEVVYNAYGLDPKPGTKVPIFSRRPLAT